MHKELYRKQSKENCLAKKKSFELLSVSSQQQNPNIIIDLTNKIYEENKNTNNNSIVVANFN